MSKQVTKTIISAYDDSETVIAYTFDNVVPEVSPFQSKLLGEHDYNNALLTLKRINKDNPVEMNINFIGSFSTTIIDEEPEFHYFVFNALDVTESTSFIVKARQSLYRSDVYACTHGEIQAETEHLFDIMDQDIYYNELLELYYLGDFRTHSDETFYEFVENQATYIHQKIIMGD